ncbi:MAG: hypothetical protein Q9183_007109, partial [Haloplaca sp. 2 TL-2023]
TLSGVHKAFVDAGADILLTATYQASFEGFAATKRLDGSVSNEKQSETQGQDTYGQEESATFMKSAIPLANQEILAKHHGQKPAGKGIALSLGSYGATMKPSTEYSGEYKPESMMTAESLTAWHERRFRVFKEDLATWNAIDYVSFETLPLLQEIKAVRHVMEKHNPAGDHPKPWWISCVFPNDDLTLPDGSTVATVVKAMLLRSGKEEQIPWGIGINCTDIKKLAELISRYEAAAEDILDPGTQWPWLVTYPDGAQGSVYNTETQQWEIDHQMRSEGPQIPWHEELAEIVADTAERGRWQGILVGGCCKTTPDSIGKLRAQLESRGSDAYFLQTG